MSETWGCSRCSIRKYKSVELTFSRESSSYSAGNDRTAIGDSYGWEQGFCISISGFSKQNKNQFIKGRKLAMMDVKELKIGDKIIV